MQVTQSLILLLLLPGVIVQIVRGGAELYFLKELLSELEWSDLKSLGTWFLAGTWGAWFLFWAAVGAWVF